MSDDDSECGCLYENGHWAWDEEKRGLKFVSNVVQLMVVEDVILAKEAAAGAVQFRNDVDVYEQLRFKNRYQRKVRLGCREVVTIQDIKDVALFTAPMSIMSEKLIHMIHQPTTERFMRALILYCQYYLQILRTMTQRDKDLEKKIRTPQSGVIEDEYRDNLCDLRLLVAKEYCTMSMANATGAGDMKKYHHMGARKLRSLTDQDAHFYETLLRMCIQIVWLALGRKEYNKIELEVNRLFKSDLFNSAEHNLNSRYIENLPAEERSVLLGHCPSRDKRCDARSPLLKEVFCHRQIDYRLLSLGKIKHEQLTPRILYLQRAIADGEETFETCKIVVGILGQKRSNYDAMLNLLSIRDSQSNYSLKKVARKSGQDVGVPIPRLLYPDITLPPKQMISGDIPDVFSSAPAPVRCCNAEQRDRWLNRFRRIINARKSTIC